MMTSNFVSITNCRSCQSSKLQVILDLGLQPLANSLVSIESSSIERKYPLTLIRCDNCTTLQLSINVSPQLLFSSYFWVTGTSKSTVLYCRKLAKEILLKCENTNPVILEIGSNDGTLLKEFTKLDIKKGFGIDPAVNIIPKDNLENIIFLPNFFSEAFAKEFVKKYGKVDILIARNVLSHVSDLDEIMRGIDIILSKKGSCVIEFHDASKLISELQFDSIYHEHTYYHTLRSITFALEKIGLFAYDASEGPISGGSIILFSKRDNSSVAQSVRKIEQKEHSLMTHDLKTWENFAKRVTINLDNIRKKLDQSKSRSCAFGSSARSSTLLNSIGDLSKKFLFIADNNPLKWNYLSPGVHLQILPPINILHANIESVFISAFNFEQEIVKQIKHEIKWSGEIILPLPNKFRNYFI